MRRYLLVTALTATLAGCVMPPPGMPEPQPPATGSCGADGMQTLVGRSAKVLETMRFAGPVRIIRPGMAVTMDYAPDRLNIEIDEAERISRVRCG